MADQDITDQDVATGVDRRQLLKGAAAAGIGIAAWSTPNIVVAGQQPSDGEVCTARATLYGVGGTNTTCTCNPGQNQDKVASYPQLTPGAFCGSYPSRTATVYTGIANENGTYSCGTEVPNTGNGICPPPFNENAGVCVSGIDPKEFCQTVVRVYDGGACPAENNCKQYTEYYGPPSPGSAGSTFLPLPGVKCQGNGDIFLRVYIQCSRDDCALDEPTNGQGIVVPCES